MRWKDVLDRSLEDRRTVLCVGLDTDMQKFASDTEMKNRSQFDINREVIEATHEVAAAYKLNLAFYEAEGYGGIRELERTVSYLREKHPEVLVILDAKKGDIGNTSKAYARAAYDYLGVDSVTLNGYMGRDAIDPFSSDPDRLCFVLCRTSNKGASVVQNFSNEKGALFIHMAELVKQWNANQNLGLVVGATYPEELGKVREKVGPEMPILIPGVGAQGGDLRRVLENGTDERGGSVLINVSRGIMFACLKEEFEDLSMGAAAARAASEYHMIIRTAMESAGRW